MLHFDTCAPASIYLANAGKLSENMHEFLGIHLNTIKPEFDPDGNLMPDTGRIPDRKQVGNVCFFRITEEDWALNSMICMLDYDHIIAGITQISSLLLRIENMRNTRG